MKILIVDDNSINLKTFSTYCSKQGYEIITAVNGVEAIKKFMSESPDLILMDVMMPVLDGFKATMEIKAMCKDRWVPIILITALNEQRNLVEGVAAGADDYLTKPVNLTILGEKIKIMKRILGMQNLLTQSITELRQYHENAEEELELAKHLMDKIIRLDTIHKTPIQMWIQPAERLCGDAIASAMTPGGVLHVMVVDGTGHGLSAALSVMPAIDVFYAMTAKGYSISSIVEELNRKVRLMLPRDRFLATSFASVDWVERTVNIWNGGGPDVYLVSEEGELIRTWKSNHLPLGILDQEQLNIKMDPYQWKESGFLYIFSDGLLDARGENGESYGEDRVIQSLRQSPYDQGFDRLQTDVRTHLGFNPSHDDISLVAIHCTETDQHKNPMIQPVVEDGESPSGRWRISLHLNASEIKMIDVIPFLMRWLEQTRVGIQSRGQFFLIASELYTNAVDHGILGLDSYIKLLPEGFEKYMKEREERLSNLEEGNIDIMLERVPQPDGSFLRLTMKDSGAGFSCDGYSNVDMETNLMPAWRGIAMVKHLCQRVEYLNEGNEVIVEYRIS